MKAIKASHAGDEGLQGQFEDMLGEVEDERPDDTPGVIFRYLLMAYYDKQGTSDWFGHDTEFTAAVQRNLLSDDGSYTVSWSSKKLRGLRKAIDAIDTFLSGPDGKVLTDSWDDHIPYEPRDIDFWRHHLHI